MTLGACLLLLAGCRTLQVDYLELSDKEGWRTEGASAERQHVTADPIDAPLEEAWIYNAGAGFGPLSPLVLRNVMLVATRKGEVHGINLETGKKAGVENFGDAIDGTPLVVGDLMYVPVADGRRALTAYNLRRGKKAWEVKGTPVETGLLAVGDGVVAVDADATVRRYRSDSKEPVWETALGDDITIHATPLLSDGRIIIIDDQGGVVALDPVDGAVQWTTALGKPVYTSVAANETHIFIPTTRARFVALDALGNTAWDFSLPDTTIRFAPPAVDKDLVIFGASDGVVRALDANTGAERWTFKDDAAITAAPLITPNTIYIGTMGKMLFGLNPADGVVQWQHELKGRVKSAMAASGGHLVVLSEPRYVYLFKPTPTGGPVASGQ